MEEQKNNTVHPEEDKRPDEEVAGTAMDHLVIKDVTDEEHERVILNRRG